jgi:hypothetical protein
MEYFIVSNKFGLNSNRKSKKKYYILLLPEDQQQKKHLKNDPLVLVYLDYRKRRYQLNQLTLVEVHIFGCGYYIKTN